MGIGNLAGFRYGNGASFSIRIWEYNVFQDSDIEFKF